MYEYANRLAERGHEVHVYHSVAKPFRPMKSPLWFKWALSILRNKFSKKWFNFQPSVQTHVVPDVINKYLPNADVVFSTWWELAYRVAALSPEKGKKFNLIQDEEVWAGYPEKVYQSYSLPITHLVIAKYLQKLVMEKSGKYPIMQNNAIDLSRFYITKPIAERTAPSVIMLYSEEKRKGSIHGLGALQSLKNRIPELQVTLFSTFPRPENLASWISFHQKSDYLPALYNEATVFFSPSLGEGWALPPAEAMACGCAVVCTNIGGHSDYAMDRKTALLVPVADEKVMEERLFELLSNVELKNTLAKNGNKFIRTHFNWETSVRQLEKLFLEKN
ncbi:MAG: glycosyltransferase family 4 protein [Sphingobacteriaceae bacterium]|nr:glycosyltransferase family 4 protein [Sphingobacteriaceae bacterium]